MDAIVDLVQFLTDPANWSGPAGFPRRILQHLAYTGAASLVAVAIALPIGLLLGHTRRFETLVTQVANLGRAIPAFGIVILAFILFGIHPLPVVLTLTALAIPPILVNTYVGVQAVDPEVVDAAQGVGMTGWQVLTRVELPVATPLIMAGIRISLVQVVATATLAAYIGLGGLGRFIFDGLSQQVLARVLAGGVLVALLALLVEWGSGRLQRAVTPRGLREAGDVPEAGASQVPGPQPV